MKQIDRNRVNNTVVVNYNTKDPWSKLQSVIITSCYNPSIKQNYHHHTNNSYTKQYNNYDMQINDRCFQKFYKFLNLTTNAKITASY